LKIRRSRQRALLALACLSLGSGGAPLARGRPAPEPVIPPDPALHSGRLPNGLRYYLLPRLTQPGHVSLRLIVQAGSLDERDDERGYAHFVEHMAFDGTVHYPAGRLVLFLQGLGLSLGADLNADTSFTHTIYKLDLPAARYLPQGLEILRDYADGLTFPDYALERQKGVILSELGARATAQYELNTRWLSFLYAGSALPERMPIGDAGLIARADAQKLRAFYRRCYRPERMIVLVVGDMVPAAVEPALRQQFATLRASGQAPPPAQLRLPAASGPAADALASPLHTSAAVDFIALVPRPGDAVRDLQAWQADAVVTSLLNRRLAERAQADPRIGRAFAAVEPGPDQWFAHFRLEAQAATNEWPRAVDLLERELRRAREQGFQPGEVLEASSGILANLQNHRDEVASYHPAALAEAVAARLASDRPWSDLDAELRASSDYLANFTPAEAAAALAALFPDKNLRLVVSRPTPLPGGPETVLAAFRADAARPLAADAPAAADQLLFHYGDIQPPGAVAERRAEPDLRLTSVAFANGVRLNLRPSKGESHRFALSARLGEGIMDTPANQPRLEQLALDLLASADLGRNTQDELERLLQLHAVAFNAGFDDNQLYLTASGPSAELPFALRFVAALLSDPKLDPARLKKAVSRYASMQRHEVESTQLWARNEILFQLASENPRLRLASLQQVSRYSFDDICAWMHQHWLEGPLEIGITGSVDPGETVAAAARTVGALPPRNNIPSAAMGRLALRPKPFARNEVGSMPEGAATLRIAWPAASAREVPENAALQLAVDAVTDRLRIKVREDLGATYAPTGGLYHYSAQPDFQFAWIELTFDPKKANALADLTLQLADDLAQHGVTPEEFARLREPRRAQTAAQLEADSWWLRQVLVRAQSQPEAVRDARALATAYTAVTLEEVNRAAARTLRSTNASAVLVMPKAATPH